MKWNYILLAALMVTVTSCGDSAKKASSNIAAASSADDVANSFNTAIAPLLNKYCTDCHGGENPKNDLSLEFAGEKDVKKRLLSDSKLFEHKIGRAHV